MVFLRIVLCSTFLTSSVLAGKGKPVPLSAEEVATRPHPHPVAKLKALLNDHFGGKLILTAKRYRLLAEALREHADALVDQHCQVPEMLRLRNLADIQSRTYDILTGRYPAPTWKEQLSYKRDMIRLKREQIIHNKNNKKLSKLIQCEEDLRGLRLKEGAQSLRNQPEDLAAAYYDLGSVEGKIRLLSLSIQGLVPAEFSLDTGKLYNNIQKSIIEREQAKKARNYIKYWNHHQGWKFVNRHNILFNDDKTKHADAFKELLTIIRQKNPPVNQDYRGPAYDLICKLFMSPRWAHLHPQIKEMMFGPQKEIFWEDALFHGDVITVGCYGRHYHTLSFHDSDTPSTRSALLELAHSYLIQAAYGGDIRSINYLVELHNGNNNPFAAYAADDAETLYFFTDGDLDNFGLQWFVGRTLSQQFLKQYGPKKSGKLHDRNPPLAYESAHNPTRTRTQFQQEALTPLIRALGVRSDVKHLSEMRTLFTDVMFFKDISEALVRTFQNLRIEFETCPPENARALKELYMDLAYGTMRNSRDPVQNAVNNSEYAFLESLIPLWEELTPRFPPAKNNLAITYMEKPDATDEDLNKAKGLLADFISPKDAEGNPKTDKGYLILPSTAEELNVQNGAEEAALKNLKRLIAVQVVRGKIAAEMAATNKIQRAPVFAPPQLPPPPAYAPPPPPHTPPPPQEAPPPPASKRVVIISDDESTEDYEVVDLREDSDSDTIVMTDDEGDDDA